MRIDANVGESLRSIRLRAGLTQGEMGMRIGWSDAAGHISRVETGRVIPSLPIVQAWLDACESSPEEWIRVMKRLSRQGEN